MMNPCLDGALDVVGMAQFQGHKPSKSPHVVHCRVCRKGPFPTAPSRFKLRPVQLFHDLQCAQGPCTGQGMSTKGGDVPQGGGMREGFHVGLRRGQSPNRHATAQSLSHAYDVGLETKMGKGPRLPGSAHSALDLVQNEQCPNLLAFLLKGEKPRCLGHPNSSISLDRFHHHGSHRGVQSFQVLLLVPRQEINVREQGAVSRFAFLVGGDGEGAMRAPVVSSLHAKQTSSACHPLGQFHGGLHGFCA